MEMYLIGLRDDICCPYLDDSLVHSKTFEYHLKDLWKIHVRFLGKLVSKDGHTMDPADLALVQAL